MDRCVSRYLSLAGIIMFVITIICYYHSSITRERVIVCIHANDVLSESHQTKNILLWNGYDRIEMKVFLRSLPNISNSCPYRNCRVTTDRRSNLLGKFDAIIFNMAVLHQLEKSDKLPPADTRESHQYYIFFSQESPFYHKENVQIKDYMGYFNWTMSYLPESNIPYPYGRIERAAVDLKSKSYPVRKKTKLVAWFVSHCNTTQSRRENYVRELQKHIPIDIFGLCGPLKCHWNSDTGISHPECYDMLEKEYKFYLSFENSLCSHYVTEKFYSILKLDVVPVVMGRANYSDIAPPYSFIDALNYSPKQLADYLLLLDGNQTLYDRYLQWKTSYIIRSGYEEMGGQALCSLCAQLNLSDDRKEMMPADVLSTWNPTTRCLNPRYVKAFLSIDRNNNRSTTS